MRIKRSESIVAELKKFMLDKKPGSVTFIVEAGGGFTEVECAFSVGGYKTEELPNAPYINYTLPGPHEIAGTTGNVVWHPEKPNEPMVHIHATLGSNKPETWVAHLHEAKVMATAEILLITSDDKERIMRKHDKDLNLWLLDLSSQKTTENPTNSNKPGFSWQVILPVGLIILGLMAITTLLFTREKKNKKK
ncbi:MAG: hypothetical protein MRECE_8c050 [Mycoplasmataceae bacterium CE_OT135]|nr:MAG: hypothetical protein MRECE_8c050 [Mycoplasmataceae bacterium CE_OT135]